MKSKGRWGLPSLGMIWGFSWGYSLGFILGFLVGFAMVFPQAGFANGYSPSSPSSNSLGSSNNSAYGSFLSPGSLALGVGFPGGGAITGTSAFGARYMLFQGVGITPLIQLSHDKLAEKSAYGLTCKGQYFLSASSSARSFPFLFSQISAGQNRGQGNVGNDDFKAGFALGLGVEVFLIKELSTSVEVGLGGDFLPSSQLTLTTATTQISLHYHFEIWY